jgi:hypothetical protein
LTRVPSLLVSQSHTNLSDWSWSATMHDRISLYPDPASALHPARFYRTEFSPKSAAEEPVLGIAPKALTSSSVPDRRASTPKQGIVPIIDKVLGAKQKKD